MERKKLNKINGSVNNRQVFKEIDSNENSLYSRCHCNPSSPTNMYLRQKEVYDLNINNCLDHVAFGYEMFLQK